jgi:hypothetical protein
MIVLTPLAPPPTQRYSPALYSSRKQIIGRSGSMSVNLDDLRAFLVTKGKSSSNIDSIIRVVKKLVSGAGVEHKSKPGETFNYGQIVTLATDLYALQAEAEEWLPYKKNDPRGCLDRGHGWALNHPIVNLRDFKEHVLAHGNPPSAPPPPPSAGKGVAPASSASTSAGKACDGGVDSGSGNDSDEDVVVEDLATPSKQGPDAAATPARLGGPSATPAEAAATYGEEILGAQVEIEFDGEAFYKGTVKKYSASVQDNGTVLRQHYVVFEDGDKKWISDLAGDEKKGLLRWPGGSSSRMNKRLKM